MTTIQAIEKIEASLETLRAHCHGQAARDQAYGNEDGVKHWTTLAAGVRLALDELRHHLEAHRQDADEPSELVLAAGAVLMQMDYLQSLWGKEGVTNSLAERLRKALEGEAKQ